MSPRARLNDCLASGDRIMALPGVVAGRLSGRCVYCGRWVGLWKDRHPACEDRHSKAVMSLPPLFVKMLSSDLPPERFAELLRSVAETSFIGIGQLRDLEVFGIRAMLSSVLQDRPPSAAELNRTMRLFQVLCDMHGENEGLDESLAKAFSVSEIWNGRILDVVSLKGETPIPLQPSERFLWIMNEVRWGEAAYASDSVMGYVRPRYIPPDRISTVGAPAELSSPMQSGDLALTNMSLYLRGLTKLTKVPISNIRSCDVFDQGIHIQADHISDYSLIVFADDPWFLVNMINGLRACATE